MPTNRKSLYRGHLIDLGIEEVLLPNGCYLDLEVVRHPGGAVIVALNDARQVCLLRQYRHAANSQTLWELPAGCIDPDDPSPVHTAQRELQEEAGVIAKVWVPLGSILTSPGFCDEILHLFLARGLTFVDSRCDEHEIIEVHWLDLEQATAMAASGEIMDAKSIAGLFRAQREVAAIDS